MRRGLLGRNLSAASVGDLRDALQDRASRNAVSPLRSEAMPHKRDIDAVVESGIFGARLDTRAIAMIGGGVQTLGRSGVAAVLTLLKTPARAADLHDRSGQLSDRICLPEFPDWWEDVSLIQVLST